MSLQKVYHRSEYDVEPFFQIREPEVFCADFHLYIELSNFLGRFHNCLRHRLALSCISMSILVPR